MKKSIFLLTFLVIVTMGCASRSGKVGKINPNDITYFEDKRVNLCFGIIGAKKGINIIEESESIGFTCVPCDSVRHLIN